MLSLDLQNSEKCEPIYSEENPHQCLPRNWSRGRTEHRGEEEGIVKQLEETLGVMVLAIILIVVILSRYTHL